MKKYITVIFLFLLNVLYSIPENIQTSFPTLNWQIENNIQEGVDKTELLVKLRAYLNNADAEVLKGLKLVLFESEYRQDALATPLQFSIDGNDTEWKNIRFRLTDPAGSVSIPNADLVDFRCFLSPDLTLYAMHKTLAKPRQTQGEESFGLDIRINNVTITIKYGIDGVRTECKIGNRIIPIEINYKVYSIAEAAIPLGKILQLAGIAQSESISIRGFTEHHKIGSIVKRSGGSSTFYSFMRDYTLDMLQLSPKRANYALELFLHLVSKDCFQEGDSITFALALANNWLYSIAEPDARIAIKEDIVKHYNYYLKIIKWQETLPIHIRLKKYPLLAKIFWANRFIYLDNTRKMTLADYREFIDTMETLEGFHKIILDNKLYEGHRFKTVARKIIDFGVKRNQYRGNIDRFIKTNTLHKLSPDVLRDYNAGEYRTMYYGRNRDWSLFKWMNYQLKRFQRTGFTRGDCITYSRVQSTLFKACGIPSTEAYRSTTLSVGVSDHLFVLYYNGFQNKWDQYDYIFNEDHAKAILVLPRIQWHHLMKDFRSATEDITTNAKKNALFLRGIETWQFEELVFNPNPLKNTNMFNNPRVIYALNDADGDGIWDEIEIKLGINPRNADSDNDGYSDLWEIEHGYNPMDNNSPGRLSFPVIDGIADNRRSTDNFISATSEEGNYRDYSEIYNAKILSARIYEDALYLSVTYYNDIRKNKTLFHSFGFMTNSSPAVNYELLLYNRIELKKNREKLAVDGIEFSCINDLEVIIPLKYFSGVSSLRITYYGYGKKGNRTSTWSKQSKPVMLLR